MSNNTVLYAVINDTFYVLKSVKIFRLDRKILRIFRIPPPQFLRFISEWGWPHFPPDSLQNKFSRISKIYASFIIYDFTLHFTKRGHSAKSKPNFNPDFGRFDLASLGSQALTTPHLPPLQTPKISIHCFCAASASPVSDVSAPPALICYFLAMQCITGNASCHPGSDALV